jgi:hypothetical protein
MSPDQLGRRYERLLVLTAPLSFAAFIVLFVAVASDSRKDNIQARCYEFAADTISKAEAELQPKWEQAKKERFSSFGGIEYKYAITKTWLVASKIDCYQLLNSEIDNRHKAAPAEIAAKFLADAKALTSTPLQLYGIEIPGMATINVLGTSISIGLMTFTQFLQILLGPLMLLWLNSLYNTRYRETIAVGTASSLEDVFPHIANVYPFGTFPEARKKSWMIYYLPRVMAALYALVRTFIVCVFLMPPVAAYLFSMYFLHSDEYTAFFTVLGSLVFIAGLANPVLEFMPWHFHKVFAPRGARA